MILGAGAVLLGWTVVETSAFHALLREQPAAAAAIDGDHPEFVLKLAQAQVLAKGGRLDPVTFAAVRRALEDAPLADEPFLIEALSALGAGDVERGERLLAEARTRNPRSRLARLLLLDRHLRAGRVADAAEEIVVLRRLITGVEDALVPELAKFAREAETRGPLIEVLRSEPSMGKQVLAHLAGNGRDEKLAFELARALPAEVRRDQEWQAALIGALVERGEVGRAFAMWRQLPGMGAAAADPGIYDGRFRGLPGPPPFNWRLSAAGAGVAERGQGGGLQAEYYGRAPAELARQVLLLPPGLYRLAVRADGDASGEGARMAWRLSCRSGAQLIDLPLRGISFSPKVIAGDFTVPAGCAAQNLVLAGVPAEFPETQSATISEVAISRAAAQ